MQLSIIFCNKLNDLVNSSDKEDIISCCQNRNTLHLQLPVIKRNNIAGLTKIEERASRRNRIADHSEIEERIKGANRDIFDISFFY